MGGPFWKVGLGRRDSLTASRALANASIPPPTSNLSALTLSFASQGLSFEDMVTLSGMDVSMFSFQTSVVLPT